MMPDSRGINPAARVDSVIFATIVVSLLFETTKRNPTWHRTIRCRSLLMCYQQEDAWDRDAIVRGFWVCPDSAWRASRVRTQRRVASAYASNGADGAIRAIPGKVKVVEVKAIACPTGSRPAEPRRVLMIGGLLLFA